MIARQQLLKCCVINRIAVIQIAKIEVTKLSICKSFRINSI